MSMSSLVLQEQEDRESTIAYAARCEALEEAAQIADRYRVATLDGLPNALKDGKWKAATDIAREIRNLENSE